MTTTIDTTAEEQITLLDHETGERHPGTFRPVREIGPDCAAGVTELDLGAHGRFYVATILHHGRAFTYCDWQAGHPEEVALDYDKCSPELWRDNATDAMAYWWDGKPHAFAQP